MSLRDRTFQTRRMTRLTGGVPEPHIEAAPPLTPAPPAPVPDAAPQPVERPQADRPRVMLSREALELKHALHDRLVREIDPSRLTQNLSPEDARRAVEDAVLELLAKESANISRTDEMILMREIADEIVGFGPIEPLLQDETVTEVMVNSPDRVFFEKEGVLFLSDRSFRDDDHIMRLIDKIVS
ncbi:MAG TPA: hypothetical protein VFI12_00245, partial [Thermomicrobiales bacterium]|nr:hypothetical protein [Thermomicrobiales bacterium]